MNTRKKGQRTFAKAKLYALATPGVLWLPWYQPPKFATPQPFDVLLLRPGYWPRFVEIRTNQWGIAKPQTRQLSALPGEGFRVQVWRFRTGLATPDLREWSVNGWRPITHPWEIDA